MRVNVPVARLPVETHEGARAVHLNPIQQLRRSLLACMLFEDSFYEDGVSIADRIQAEVAEVLKRPNGAAQITALAFEARSQFKLRHAPLWLLHALLALRAKPDPSELARVLQRPDELPELLAMYWKDGRKPIPKVLKRGLALAFGQFDEYALSKYANREGAISLRDVLFLSHPKPKDEAQAALWKRLANRELTAPATWERELSAGKDKRATFERLLAERKLGALALLMNLRGMKEAGVPDTTLRDAVNAMKTERVLPFRFISAARHAPQLEPELEGAMFRCLTGVPKLSGKTVLVVDNSGSMYGEKVSRRSELTRADAACALAMLLREICQQVDVISFSDFPAPVPPRRGFALRDAIQAATPRSSTMTALALALAAQLTYDRCIVITDEQSHQVIGPPVAGKLGYFVNVANDQNGIGYGAWTHVDGWSEAVVEYIVQAGGMGDLERILNRIAEGSSTESAVQEALRSNYDDLAQATVVYLRKTYL